MCQPCSICGVLFAWFWCREAYVPSTYRVNRTKGASWDNHRQPQVVNLRTPSNHSLSPESDYNLRSVRFVRSLFVCMFTWIGNLTLQGKDSDHQCRDVVFWWLLFAPAVRGCGCLGSSDGGEVTAPHEPLNKPTRRESL